MEKEVDKVVDKEVDKVVDKEVDKEPHRILGALSKAVKETNKEMGSRDHVHTGWCTGHNSHRRLCTEYRTIDTRVSSCQVNRDFPWLLM